MVIANIKEVRKLFNFQISEATASRRINLVRSALNKPKPKPISLVEFCIYYEIQIE